MFSLLKENKKKFITDILNFQKIKERERENDILY